MGREVKRVPVNFSWPLNKIWKGYLNPFYKFANECSACDASGYSPGAKRFYDQWYGNEKFDPSEIGSEPITRDNEHIRTCAERNIQYAINNGHERFHLVNGVFSRDKAIEAETHRLYNVFSRKWLYQLCQDDVDALVEKKCLRDFTHICRKDMNLEEHIRNRAYYLWIESGRPLSDGIEFWDQAYEEYTSRYYLPFPNGYHPTAKEINTWSILTTGHDSISCSVCVKARAKREGIEPFCEICKGHGEVWDPPEMEQKAEEWESEEPPTGEAYQIWETVSEGSPISPAFQDPRDLAKWMVENDKSITQDTNYEGWIRFILEADYAFSMICTFVDGEFKLESGVKHLSS